jgi:fructokinase
MLRRVKEARGLSASPGAKRGAGGEFVQRAPGRHSATAGRRWDGLALEAEYLALGLLNVVATLSPQRIILGGGVMNEPTLLPLVRQHLAELAGGYFDAPELSAPGIDSFVVAPALAGLSGVLGAFELARLASDSD